MNASQYGQLGSWRIDHERAFDLLSETGKEMFGLNRTKLWIHLHANSDGAGEFRFDTKEGWREAIVRLDRQLVEFEKPANCSRYSGEIDGFDMVGRRRVAVMSAVYGTPWYNRHRLGLMDAYAYIAMGGGDGRWAWGIEDTIQEILDEMTSQSELEELDALAVEQGFGGRLELVQCISGTTVLLEALRQMAGKSLCKRATSLALEWLKADDLKARSVIALELEDMADELGRGAMCEEADGLAFVKWQAARIDCSQPTSL